MHFSIVIFLIAVFSMQPSEGPANEMASPLLKMTPEQAKQLLEAQQPPLTPDQEKQAEEARRHLMQDPVFLKKQEILDQIGRAGGGDWAELEDDPDRLEMVLEARRLDDAGKSREAIELYERAIAQNPGSPANAAIEFRIAAIYDYILHENWTPDKQEAKRRYEEIVSKYDPTRSWVIRSREFLAGIYCAERNYDKAREQLEAIADAKKLLDEHPEQFHEVDALWVELLGLDIEKRLTDLEKEREYQNVLAERRAMREAGIEPSPPPGYVAPTEPPRQKESTAVRFRLPPTSRASEARVGEGDRAPASPAEQPATRNRSVMIGVLAVVACVSAVVIVLLRKRAATLAGSPKRSQ